MPDDSLLHLPLTAVGMSEVFTKTAMMYEYNTLADILEMPLTELVQKEWFSTAMFEELGRVVKTLNIHNSKISKIEQGKINVTVLTVLELSAALEVSAMELLNFQKKS